MLNRKLTVRRDSPDADLIYKPPRVALPDKVSLSKWRAPIRDQGTESSCTAFTGRGAIEFIRNKMGLAYVELSTQYLYNRILTVDSGSAAQDNGAEIRSIPKALNKYGICKEAAWPYTSRKFSDAPTKEADADASCHRIAAYLRVTSIDDLRHAIAIDQLAVMIGVNVYPSIDSDAVAASGLIPLPKPGESPEGGHALLCDGYDFTGPEPVFFGPNSWGTSWGSADDGPSASGERRGIYRMPLAFVQDDSCINDVWVVTK